MRKEEFLAQLRKGLSGLPQDDVQERVIFYGEMIDDQMEEGASEEDAVAAVGSVDEIVAQAVAETPLAKLAKARLKAERRISAGELVLLVLGSPIWLSLGIVGIAVLLTLYVVLWSVLICVWSVFAALAASAGCGVAMCVFFAVGGNGTSGLVMLAAGLVCAGLSIFLFYGCRAATTGILLLTKKLAVWMKNCFIKKGEVS